MSDWSSDVCSSDLGPNGSGKTTLFNSIVGYHPIDSGSIAFEGREISALKVPQIARLGLLRTFQQTRIYSKMDCVRNMLISVPHRNATLADLFKGHSADQKDKAESLLRSEEHTSEPQSIMR